MNRNSKGLAMTVGILAAIGVSVLATLAALNRRDQFVGLNQEIQYDDFAFSVESVRKTASLGIGQHQSKPQGLYYVITLKIANHAKRVDYRFKYQSARLVDVEEKEFGLSPAGQQALESATGKRCADPIPAGASCVTEVVFDLPSGAELKHFRISESGLVGDILNAIFYGKKRIELGSIQ
jgi:Domain of unknown function (DUF4352)